MPSLNALIHVNIQIVMKNLFVTEIFYKLFRIENEVRIIYNTFTGTPKTVTFWCMGKVALFYWGDYISDIMRMTGHYDKKSTSQEYRISSIHSSFTVHKRTSFHYVLMGKISFWYILTMFWYFKHNETTQMHDNVFSMDYGVNRIFHPFTKTRERIRLHDWLRSKISGREFSIFI